MAQFCGLSTSIPFPTFWTMAYQIAIFFVMEDTWHYFMHRALHWGPLYKAIHKIHHQYSAPFGLAAEYASPIEVMILGFGTVSCPILWCAITGDLHILTMYIWIVLRLFQAIDAHSGYEFPWSLHHFLPFWAGADHHDLHHEKFIGNYSSSFRWWDYVLDTEYTPDALKRRRENKSKGTKAQWGKFLDAFLPIAFFSCLSSLQLHIQAFSCSSRGNTGSPKRRSQLHYSGRNVFNITIKCLSLHSIRILPNSLNTSLPPYLITILYFLHFEAHDRDLDSPGRLKHLSLLPTREVGLHSYL